MPVCVESCILSYLQKKNSYDILINFTCARVNLVIQTQKPHQNINTSFGSIEMGHWN